jgi:hypothetical protein
MENLKMNVVKKFKEEDEKDFEHLFNWGSRNIGFYFYPNTRILEITEELVQDAPINQPPVHWKKKWVLLDFYSLSAHCRLILHQKMRTIFLMSRVSGLSYNEIAISLSIGNESFKDRY